MNTYGPDPMRWRPREAGHEAAARKRKGPGEGSLSELRHSNPEGLQRRGRISSQPHSSTPGSAFLLDAPISREAPPSPAASRAASRGRRHLEGAGISTGISSADMEKRGPNGPELRANDASPGGARASPGHHRGIAPPPRSLTRLTLEGHPYRTTDNTHVKGERDPCPTTRPSRRHPAHSCVR